MWARRCSVRNGDLRHGPALAPMFMAAMRNYADPVSPSEPAPRERLIGATPPRLRMLIAAIAVGGVTGCSYVFDSAVLLGLRATAGPTGAVVALARGITVLGNDVTLWAVTLLAAGYLLAVRHRAAAVYLLITAAGGGMLTASLKALVDRPRPALVDQLVEVHSRSFPSGHAMNATFVYATLALLAAHHAPTRTGRVFLGGATVVLVVLIGASRVVLGVHWPSDVLAGWAAGSGWTLLTAATLGRWARRARRSADR